MSDPNLILLESAAERLQGLLGDFVFVGGATLGLLIPDSAAAPVRPTTDVDVIAEVSSYIDYVAISECLRRQGFAEDERPGAPLCRWLHGELILDVMPTEASALGFGNRWYRPAFEAAQLVGLPSGTAIRVITAPFFLGAKFEAFRGRGNQDFLSSRDLEDFISVIDGRQSILNEIQSAPDDLRRFLAGAVRELLAETRFTDVLPGYLLPDDISQQRLPGLMRKLRSICGS